MRLHYPGQDWTVQANRRRQVIVQVVLKSAVGEARASNLVLAKEQEEQRGGDAHDGDRFGQVGGWRHQVEERMLFRSLHSHPAKNALRQGSGQATSGTNSLTSLASRSVVGD